MGYLVDCDRHIDDTLGAVAPFVDEPWRRSLGATLPQRLIPGEVGDVEVGGRIRRSGAAAPPRPADVEIVFPSLLLGLGSHPNADFQAALAFGYARWLTEAYLPEHPQARGMLYLPPARPAACAELVRRFGGDRRVVGGFVTNAGFPQLHENRFMAVYEALEGSDLALGFHPVPVWQDPPFDLFDSYLPVWALGQPFSQCIMLTNWVLHGLPDRFPRLRCVVYEAGVSWISFVCHRLDQEFLKRPSEAPLLRERPSHYLARCFFATHPVDQVADPAELAAPVRQVGVAQWVYASNYPRWDCDLPQAVDRLAFLREDERGAILGGNARRLFRGLDAAVGGAAPASAGGG